MNKKFTKFIFLIIALILVTASVFAALLTHQKSKQAIQPTTGELAQEGVKEKESEPMPRADTSNWQMYRNEELGVAFDLPREWTVSTNVLVDKSSVDIGIYPTSEASKQSVSEEPFPIITASLDIHNHDEWYIYKSGGDEFVSSGKKYLRKGPADSETIRYAFTTYQEMRDRTARFDRSVEFVGFLNYKNQYDVEKILFAIADSVYFIVDTSEWETYQNKEYGFEFKYPKEWSAPDIVEIQSDGTVTLGFCPFIKTWSDTIEFQKFGLKISPGKNQTRFAFVFKDSGCENLTEKEVCFLFSDEWAGNEAVVINDYSDLEQLKTRYIKEFEIDGLRAYVTAIGAETSTTYVRIEGTNHGFHFKGLIHSYEPGDVFHALVNTFREIN